MSFVEKPMDEVKEKEIGPKGLYNLVIKDVQEKMDGDVRKNLLAIIEITKAPQGAPPLEELNAIMHNLSMIVPGDTEEKANGKILFGARFCHWFGVDMKGRTLSSLTAKELIGKKALNQQVDIKVYQGVSSNVLVLKPIPKKK